MLLCIGNNEIEFMKKDIIVKKRGRKPAHPEGFAKIGAVKAGGFIVIKKKDWPMKTKPGQHIIRKHTGREFKAEMLADESGWKVTAL